MQTEAIKLPSPWDDPIIIALKKNGDSTPEEVAYLLMGMNPKYTVEQKRAIILEKAQSLISGGAIRFDGEMLRISHWFHFPKANGGKL